MANSRFQDVEMYGLPTSQNAGVYAYSSKAPVSMLSSCSPGGCRTSRLPIADMLLVFEHVYTTAFT